MNFSNFTCGLSLETGNIFVHAPSTNLSDKIGRSITLIDGADKRLVLSLDSPGSGTTLSAEGLASFDNYAPPNNFETFIANGKDITSAIQIDQSRYDYAIGNAGGAVMGELYLYTSNLTLNSGTQPYFHLLYSANQGISSKEWYLEGGFHSYLHTSKVDGFLQYAAYISSGYSCDFSLVQSLKKVLTPSTDGAYCTIISEDSGFNRMATSYTALIDTFIKQIMQSNFIPSFGGF
jgi:hypothetical protein